MQTIKLRTTLNRFCTFYKKDDAAVPQELFNAECTVPDLSDIRFPLPSRKKDYTCSAISTDGVLWLGSQGGVTRWDEAAEDDDKVMHFGGDRYLYDNKVVSLIPDSDKGVWVQTETGVVHIEMKPVSPRQKAEMLLEESRRIVDRRGMYSQKRLATPRDLDSFVPYGHSDNDGGFTSWFSVGMLHRYAVLKRELGKDAPETKEALNFAMRTSEACMLLLHISKRGNGFPARSYLAPDEPVPDDGLFYRIQGDKAVGVETTDTKKKGISGMEIDASAPIPERLRKLFTERGYTEEGIVYKGDTSSDEVTAHFMQLYYSHLFLKGIDPEFDELVKNSATGLMSHIIDNGYQLMECNGQPTTWAKWNLEYFNTAMGWTDACLNSAELLSYLKMTMAITGEKGRWQEEYEKLIGMGYADLVEKHYDRAYQTSLLEGNDIAAELMYGDNMLAVCSFWALCTLEEDPELLAKYKRGFETWRGTVCCEDMPGYEYPFALSCGTQGLNMEGNAKWFERFNVSRLAAGVYLEGRNDVAKKHRWNYDYVQTSFLLQPDEHFIAKYDRDPWEYKDEDSGGMYVVESCYVYTYAYWIGIYHGFIED
ncbi:MAG: hypothetical protein IJA02_05455 [Clostridia bacterium]|nr:hypothetical protein [Clostridia bacterium]